VKDAVTTGHSEDSDISTKMVKDFKGQQKCWEYIEAWINIQVLWLREVKLKKSTQRSSN